jgi:hypothetical protein
LAAPATSQQNLNTGTADTGDSGDPTNYSGARAADSDVASDKKPEFDIAELKKAGIEIQFNAPDAVTN